MQAAKERFASQGYYLARGLFDKKWIASLGVEFDRIVAQMRASGEAINARWGGAPMHQLGAGDTVVLHTHNVQQYSALWLRAFLHPPFLDTFEALLGPDIVLHHSKLFMKPPKIGAPFPMHQDWSYFPTEKDQMVAAIIHLSDATDEMGCLRVYPGSHHLGRQPASDGWAASEFARRYPLAGAKPVEARAGDVLFFHYFLVHGSMPNSSMAVRKTVLVQCFAGTDTVEQGVSHPNENLVLRGWNHHASRQSAGRLK